MVLDLLQRLRDLGVRLSADGDDLRVSAPKGRIDAALSARIREHKAGLIAFLAEAETSRQTIGPVTRLADGAEPLLAPAQARLLDLHQLGAAALNVPGAWRLAGELNESALERALQIFYDRHEVFHYRFFQTDGEPAVRLVDPAPLPFEQIDASHVPRAERDAAIADRIVELSARAFDPSAEPCVRFHLLALAPDDHVLLLVAHALIWDGWCFDILLDELSTTYAALLGPVPPAQRALPVRYRDFVAWFAGLSGSPVMSTHVDWWLDRLRTAGPRLCLPTDRPPPLIQSHDGGRVFFDADPRVTSSVRGLCLREDASLAMAMVAALATVLHRLGGGERVLITMPVRNRPRPELEGIVGRFSNHVFLQIDFDQAPTFRDVLGRARDAVLSAMAHEMAPAELVTDRLGQRRRLDDTALYQVVLSQQYVGDRPLRLGATPMVAVEHAPPAVRADLTVWVSDRGDHFDGALDYRTDLFERSTGQRLCDALIRVLDAGSRDPDRSVASLPIVSREEARSIAVWQEGPPAPSCPGTLLAAVLEHDEVATAVAGGLSYGELATSVDRVAAFLRDAGVGPGDAVGGAFGRGPAAAIAALATWAADAIYVPMDPQWPEAFRSRVSDHAAVKLVLDALPDGDDGASHTPHVPGSVAPPQPRNSRIGNPPCIEGEQMPGARPAVQGDPIALRVFEGACPEPPAPLEISHTALLGTVLGAGSIRRGDRAAVLTRPCRLEGLVDLLRPLVAGATLLAPDDAVVSSDWALREALDRSEVSVATATARQWRALRSAGASFAGLQTALVRGPPGEHHDLRQIAETVVLLHGGAAASVDVLYHRVGEDDPASMLGTPAAGTSARIVDRHGNAVPIGVTGELQLASGDRPYRSTEWRARWRSTGALQAMARVDDRVIVGDATVDPAWVEARLQQAPGVKAARVRVEPAGDGEERLLAWVVLERQVAPDQVREQLAQTLPRSHVPRVLVEVSALPSDGKRTLLDPLRAAALLGVDATPKGGVEAIIAEVWAQSLGRGGISAHDNFFELGGSSLTAIQVVGTLADRLRWRPSPRLLAFQSLRQIAERCETERR